MPISEGGEKVKMVTNNKIKKAKEGFRYLKAVKEGKKLQTVPALVLQRKSYIKAKWRKEPYIDNPQKMNKVFDRWVLTPKGRKLYLRGKKVLRRKK